MKLPRGRVLWMFFVVFTLFYEQTTHELQSCRCSLKRLRRIQNNYRGLRRAVKALTQKLDRLQKEVSSVSSEVSSVSSKVSSVSSKVLGVASTCPVGFVSFYRRCLWFVFEPRKKWTDAKQFCLQHSSRLVIDNSTRKHEFIVTFLKNNSPSNSGLSDFYTSGNFGCIKGETPWSWNPGAGYNCDFGNGDGGSKSFTDWHWDSHGEQVSSSKETYWTADHPPEIISMRSKLSYSKVACLRLSRNKTTFGQWVAADCNAELPFICELKLPKVIKEKKKRHDLGEL